ncbi:MAG TPA: hypothetical protein VFE17_11895, partial [Candidatus Baltobacteraceae bacterium]|nr:hypothetical protein [Candidatus Baltobacteraceae bacterium]
MTAPVWRTLLTIAALFALFLAFVDLFDRGRFPNIGFTYDTVSETQAVVREVFDGSTAQRAGVKAGDRVDAPWFRYEHTLGPGLAGLARAGAPLAFYDERLGRRLTIITAPIANIFSSSRIGAHMLRIFGFLLALGLFWSRPGDRAARAFGTFLIVYGVQTFGNTGTSIFGLNFGYIVGVLLTPVIPYTLVLFCCWFPERYPKDGRRTISIIATALAGFFVLLTLSSMVYASFGIGPHLPGSLFFDLGVYVEPAVFAVLTVIALIIDFRRSAQLDRLRLEWLTLGMAFIMYSYTSLSWFPGLFTTAAGAFNDLGDWLSNLGEVLGILCILYALFRYRVLDLTFAINRAAVFGLVSSAIVALFVLVEYLVSRYVESYSHLTGTIITLGSALAIGVGMRTLHRRVDGFADRLIFRARYEAEKALRSFGRRAAFITSEQTLQERTVSALTEYGWAEHAALYLARTDGDFALGASRPEKPIAERISAHDPTVLALKDSRTAQLVHAGGSAVDAELVFPMIARGELIGFAACGKRRIRETYTPDEMDAMNYALEHVAVQLDVILMQRLQVQLREVQELVRAYALLGAEASRVLAGIASISGI